MNLLKKYLTILAVGGLILVPRVGLLFNGLDHQRIWDTNTPDTFRFITAVHDGQLRDFFSADHKYPLLGSYVFVPVVAAYYEIKKIAGIYHSPDDFIRAYALDETNLFFWIRFEMLALNFLALGIVYAIAKKYIPHPLAGWGVLFLAGIEFYTTLFSVTPRIHSFAFLGGALTLAASLLLCYNKKPVYYTLAFGAAAFAASVSQSGFTAFILPILAHLYNEQSSRWEIFNWRRYAHGWFLGSLGLALIAVVLIGYPQLVIPFFFHTKQSASLLSREHSQPQFGVIYFIRFLRDYFFILEPLFGWVFISGFGYSLWLLFKKRLSHPTPLVGLAMAQSIFFLLAFGFTDIVSGRFTLVIMPALLLLSVCIIFWLLSKPWFVCPLAFIVLVQLYGVAQLAGSACAGDTREQAARFLLSSSRSDDRITTTLDYHLLGLVPTPETMVETDGAGDALIIQGKLRGEKSRPIFFVDSEQKEWLPRLDAVLASSTYLVVAHDNTRASYEAERHAKQNHFKLVAQFLAHTSVEDAGFIPWDIPTPFPSTVLPLALAHFRAFGPSISIYHRE